jgi:hypothetical protein
MGAATERRGAAARLPGMSRRLLLAVVIALWVSGCGVLPVPIGGGEVIVMNVANNSPGPARLAVAMARDEGRVVGTADPTIVPAGQTVLVRFVVPAGSHWSIWANGGELMGDFDLKGQRGNVPMGIVIDVNGSPSWWCEGNCP